MSEMIELVEIPVNKSRYTESVTIICPEPKIDNLNHLSGCWGLSLADYGYFTGTNYALDGTNYSVRHTVATGRLIAFLGEDLVRPDFDVADEYGNYVLDLTKAAAAKANIVLFELQTDENGVISQPYPTGKIVYALNIPTKQVIESYGLKKIINEQL